MALYTRDQLVSVFRQIDKDNNGCLSAVELQQALSNGTWMPFNIMTVQAMIGMFSAKSQPTSSDLFSSNRSFDINFEEFVKLWKFIEDWQVFFRAYDKDNSGSIDFFELKSAIMASGYRLSDAMLRLMMVRFDRQKKGIVYFDDFVHLCILLQKLTREFRTMDTDMDGYILINYEKFLFLILSAIA